MVERYSEYNVVWKYIRNVVRTFIWRWQQAVERSQIESATSGIACLSSANLIAIGTTGSGF